MPDRTSVASAFIHCYRRLSVTRVPGGRFVRKHMQPGITGKRNPVPVSAFAVAAARFDSWFPLERRRGSNFFVSNVFEPRAPFTYTIKSRYRDSRLVRQVCTGLSSALVVSLNHARVGVKTRSSCAREPRL